jgi:phosphate/sulfate permease
MLTIGTIATIARRAVGSWQLPLVWAQGIYYVVTGLWPIVSIDSFQQVTGHKTDNLPTGREADHWLVVTVAVLILVIAAALLTSAASEKETPRSTIVLAIGSALGLAVVDVVFVLQGVIAPIYLLDAMVECCILGSWLAQLFLRQLLVPRFQSRSNSHG